MRFPASVLILAAAALAAGCGSSSIRVHAIGRAPMNLNDAGQSTAVQVVCFALRAEGRFRNAAVDALWEQDRATLGEDLIGDPVSMIITPAGSGEAPTPIDIPVPAGTAFIGVLAKFPKPDARNQRTLLIPLADASGARLTLTGSSIELAK